MRRTEWAEWVVFFAMLAAVLIFAAGMATGQVLERRAMAQAFPEIARWLR